MVPVRVLHFTIGGPEFTGIASFLYQYYKKIDQKKVQFDFVFARENSMSLVKDDEVFASSNFIELHTGHRPNKINYWELISGIENVLKHGEYDVFHINTYRVGITMACIAAAKKSGTRTIISHSHNVRLFIKGESKKRRIVNLIKSICAIYIRKNSDYLFACSKAAGKALFGKKGVCQSNFKVIKNAIDGDSYVFNEQTRKDIRNKYDIEPSKMLMLQIGRLCLQKNQKFGIDVAYNVLEAKRDAEMWFIGSGPDQKDLEEYAKSLNIFSKIRFLGQRNDVNQILQGADVLIFPSHNEGLGIVAIEAQASGLPVYASTEIPEETRITDLISYLPLTDGPEKWAEYIINDIPKHKRRDTRSEISDSGYDITSAAKWMEEFYVRCSQKGSSNG